jgi:predicted DNA-binding helix-hairpin-helix protein
MIAVNEVDRLSREVNELVKEWGRLRRHPSTAVERAEIARRAQELLTWVEVELQLLVDKDRAGDKDIVRVVNTLYELQERLKRVINEVY